MKIKSRILLISIFICFLVSCGGVVGNIEKYSFPNISLDSLKHAMNKVYDNYTELYKSDTLYGKNDGIDFYYVVNADGTKYVFLCNVVAYPAPK